MTPFEQDVINYIDDIENTLSAIDSRMNELNYQIDTTTNQNLEIIKQNQQTLISGDLMIIENQETIKNEIGLVAIILTTSLIFTFILRSLK